MVTEFTKKLTVVNYTLLLTYVYLVKEIHSYKTIIENIFFCNYIFLYVTEKVVEILASLFLLTLPDCVLLPDYRSKYKKLPSFGIPFKQEKQTVFFTVFNIL